MRLQEYLSDFMVLLEYDQAITVQKFGDQLVKQAKRDRRLRQVQDPVAILAQIEEADPTKNKQYVLWLVRQFLKGVQVEDLLSTVKLNLTRYQKLKDRKKLPAEHRDIGKLDVNGLNDVMDQYNASFINNQGPITDKGKYEVIHDGEDTLVVRLKDEQAARYFGQRTSWCTRGEEGMTNYYETYAADGDLFVVIPKHPSFPGEKYQIHRESRQCKDVKDNSFKFPSLIRKYPELAEAFKKVPAFADLPYLNSSKMDLETRRRAEEEKRKQREAEVADLLKSLWN